MIVDRHPLNDSLMTGLSFYTMSLGKRRQKQCRSLLIVGGKSNGVMIVSSFLPISPRLG